MNSASVQQYQYDVALSFAGEDRALAELLAEILQRRGVSVFYDKFEQAGLWGKDLYTHLADIYTNKARYCVMFLSVHYAHKLWTNHERSNAQARAFRERQEYILPLRLDDTEIPGIAATVGYVHIRDTSIESVAGMVEAKLGRQTASSAQVVHQPEPGKLRVVPIPQVKRTFSDLDRDQYLLAAIAFIRDYFKEALSQLEAKVAGVRTALVDLNAMKFVCRIYKDGARQNECKIWIGGRMSRDSISYYEGQIEIDNDTTLNDSLTIAENGQELKLKLSNYWLGGHRPADEAVSAEGAAEYLWRRFTSKLNQ